MTEPSAPISNVDSILIVGCYVIYIGIDLSRTNTATQALLVFGVAIFCLIFFLLARFKRFKGLGIEAELWEDKQEEAERT